MVLLILLLVIILVIFGGVFGALNLYFKEDINGELVWDRVSMFVVKIGCMIAPV